MEIQKIINELVAFGQSLFPGIPAHVIQLWGSVMFGAVAFLLLLLGLVMLRSSRRNKGNAKTSIPLTLQEMGTILDIYATPEAESVSMRCVLTKVTARRMLCEIIERQPVLTTGANREIFCVFPPVKTKRGKINAFTARLHDLGKSGRKASRIVLDPPTKFELVQRRKHTRKKVADQQFIRVKLWLENPIFSDTSYQDAVPHIGVNSFATDEPEHSGNSVVNISNGGVGLVVQDESIPEDCAPDSDVVVNLFMFNFKEKTFKPYWYAGTIRSLETSRQGFTRMGIEFTSRGQPDEHTGRLNWENMEA